MEQTFACGLTLTDYLAAWKRKDPRVYHQRRRGWAPRAASCSFAGCTEAPTRRDLCPKHYQQLWRAGKIQKLPPVIRSKNVCNVTGCNRKVNNLGVCLKHWKLIKRRLAGKLPKPIGWIDALGYKHIGAKGTGGHFEHRSVMEEILGRSLLKSENVHHVNGQRADNRPENLELWNTNQPKGQRIPDKILFAREMLALYGTKDEQRRYIRYRER
jgi:hypothetical protein